MKPRFTILIISLFLFVPQLTSARTNCDSQAKPAFDCPTGYSMTCIPVGGDHWGCGREVNGQIIEAPPVQQQNPTLDPGTTTNVNTQQTAPAQTRKTQNQPAASQVTTPTQGNSVTPTNTLDTSPVQDEQGSKIPIVAPEPQSIPITATATFSMALYAMVTAVTLALFWFGWRKWLKRSKKTGPVVGPIKARKCPRCNGTGKVKESYTETYPCGHCKSSGIDPCHHCGGTGRYGVGLTVPQTEEEVQSLMQCDFCGGSGKKTLRAGGAEANVFPCCFCKGKCKEIVTRQRDVTCPKCGGSGEANR